MSLPRFADLTTRNRIEPTVEYPGKWLVALNGNIVEKDAGSLDAAIRKAKTVWEDAPMDSIVAVAWEASNDDPRIGELWFTGFYQHGKIDPFGRYR